MRARGWVGMLLLGGAGLALGAGVGTGERSEAIYPRQRLPLRFDHQVHLADGMSCTSCHAGARKSTRPSDWLLPAHPECEDCHDLEKAARGEKTDPPASCETCHPGFVPSAQQRPARVELPAANLRFDHRLHVEKKVRCQTCHGEMEGVGLATRAQLPKMATCLECHDGAQAKAECATCHLTGSGGRLITQFTSGLLKPMRGNPFGMDHGPRFEFTHAARAASSPAQCLTCHAERECQSCHDAVRKPLSVHPNDWISLHPSQVRNNALRCDSCHRLQSFCVACHERAGVANQAHPTLQTGAGRVHPPLSVWVETPGPQHHSVQASRDLRSCISCHREETCLTCHSEKLGGSGRVEQGINPHPPGFVNTCQLARSRNDRACVRCHTEVRLNTLCP